MDIKELKQFLETLTIKQLKAICNTKRLWGVYNSYPAISGYSKCKTKKELVLHIFEHYNYYSKKHYGDNEVPDYFGYIQKDIDYIYNGLNIDLKTIKINYLGEV